MTMLKDDLRRRREELEAVLEEFYADSEYFERRIVRALKKASAGKKIEKEFRDRLKNALRDIESRLQSAVKDAREKKKSHRPRSRINISLPATRNKAKRTGEIT